MVKEKHDIAQTCLGLLIRPVMRFCLRRSLKIQEIMESCKVELINASVLEMNAIGEKVSVSRLSIMTGIHRGDIMRIYKNVGDEKSSESFLTRLIGVWQTDKRFMNHSGRPRTLQFDGKLGEFAELVHAVSGELSPYTILFELERLGVVVRSPKGVRLTVSQHIVTADVEESFQHLSQDSHDLIAAVEENSMIRLKVPNLHLRTEYDNVSKKHIDKIRDWFVKEGSAFHTKSRNYLARFDRDINPDPKDDSPPVRVTVCSFSRVDDEIASSMEEREMSVERQKVSKGD